jgi:A/G-specific adenine glycosylase
MPVHPEFPSPEYAQELQRRLLAWFRRAQRRLPWRRDRDPYRIWVSEIMLQQTQVATVIPYYHRFLKAFPTLTALADASEVEVLRLWEGLGYYRRARDLHRAARLIVQRFQGKVPCDPEHFATLPGIGRYTLGAVLSQAFDRRLPILEANSLRVLSRWFACRQNPRKGAAQRWLWQAAECLLPRRRVGEFNQAVMELGALLCTPRQPVCTRCPVADHCAARREGLQDELPVPPPTKTAIPVQEVGLILWRRRQVLLVQRPAQGRWANLWEFPHGVISAGESVPEARARVLQELTGLEAEFGPELATLRHGITRYQITLTCFQARHIHGRFRSAFYRRGEWVKPEQLPTFPLSVPQRQLAEMILDRLPGSNPQARTESG